MAQYSVDEKNRLIINKRDKAVCVNGSFTIDKNNSLIYLVNAPEIWKKEQRLSNKIIFKGQWQLDNNHNLILVLDDDSILKLSGEIISFESNKIIFEIKSTSNQNQNSIGIIKLTGIWNADKFNRIYFCVAKRNPDFLFFEAGWRLNENQQIVYSYSRTNLIRKTKEVKKIVLSGFWQLNQKNQLTYIISKSIGSYFEFKVQLESPNLYPKQGVIKYRMGIGIRQKKKDKILSFFGTWKINKDFSLTFELDYGNGKIKSWNFGSEVYLTQNKTLEIALLSSEKNKLGIKLTYSFKFLQENNGELFLRIKKIQDETGIEGGFKVKY